MAGWPFTRMDIPPSKTTRMDTSLQLDTELAAGQKRAGTPLRHHRTSFLTSHDSDDQHHGHTNNG